MRRMISTMIVASLLSLSWAPLVSACLMDGTAAPADAAGEPVVEATPADETLPCRQGTSSVTAPSSGASNNGCCDDMPEGCHCLDLGHAPMLLSPFMQRLTPVSGPSLPAAVLPGWVAITAPSLYRPPISFV